MAEHPVGRFQIAELQIGRYQMSASTPNSCIVVDTATGEMHRFSQDQATMVWAGEAVVENFNDTMP